MSRDIEKYIITKPNGEQIIAKIKWSVSHAYGTSGYPICGLYFPGGKVASCKGGGWNGCGSEAAAMRQWAIDNYDKLIPQR